MMEKKVSLSPFPAKVGWLIVISNVIFLIFHYSEIIGYEYPFFLFFAPFGIISAEIFATITPLINIGLGIGIIHLHSKTRKFFVIHQVINGCFFIFITILGGVLGMATKKPVLSELLIMVSAILGALFVYTFYIVFFTRPKVKVQFSAKGGSASGGK